MLLEGKSNDVMSKIHILLSDKRVNPFTYKRIQCRVLSGEEEGAFGWLSVNYLSNFFQVDGTYLQLKEISSDTHQLHYIPLHHFTIYL